jgi:hypothetical protein
MVTPQWSYFPHHACKLERFSDNDLIVSPTFKV